MKRMILIALIVALAADPIFAAQPRPPLLGTWALDLERSQIPSDARPQSVTITYSDVGNGKWNTSVAIVGADGAKINATGTYPLDGTLAPSTGYPGVDAAAVKVPAPNVMVAAFYKAGTPRSTRTYIVSPDDKTMMENIVWLNSNGSPEIGTNQYNRVR